MKPTDLREQIESAIVVSPLLGLTVLLAGGLLEGRRRRTLDGCVRNEPSRLSALIYLSWHLPPLATCSPQTALPPHLKVTHTVACPVKHKWRNNRCEVRL